MTSSSESSMESIFGFWWTACGVAWASTHAFSCTVRSFSSLTNILLAWDVPSSMFWIGWELLKRRLNVLEEEAASYVNHGIFLWGVPWGANALDSMLHLESNIGFNVGSSLFGSQLENNAFETNYTTISPKSNCLGGVMWGLTFHVVVMFLNSMSFSFVPSRSTSQLIQLEIGCNVSL